MLLLGQSVPLTGTTDQIGPAYFDAINTKNGTPATRSRSRLLTTFTTPPRPPSMPNNASTKVLTPCLDSSALQAAMPPRPLQSRLACHFCAPFAASDASHAASANNAFQVWPALSDEAYKIVRHCTTLSHNRIAIFTEDNAMGRAGIAAVLPTPWLTSSARLWLPARCHPSTATR